MNNDQVAFFTIQVPYFYFISKISFLNFLNGIHFLLEQISSLQKLIYKRIRIDSQLIFYYLITNSNHLSQTSEMQNDDQKRIIRIVAVSDTHDTHKNFLPEDFPPADIFIHAGDFTRMSRVRQFRKFRQFLQSLPYKRKIVIPGNHDFGLQLDMQRYKAISERFSVKSKDMVEPKVQMQKLKEVCTLLIHQKVQIQGVKIFGSPYVISNNIMGFTYLPKDGEVVWSNLPQDVDILVTHCPPFGIMDQSVHSKLNTGCKGLLQAVVKMKPKLHIFGHIHEGHGHIIQEDIRFYNVAYLNAGYSPENKPVLIELEVQEKVNDTK